MNTTRRSVVTAAVSLALVAAVGLGYWWGRTHGSSSAADTSSPQSAERKALYWYDPMVPDQHFDKPGKSPFMDMQLVPKYAGEGEANGVVVSAASVQNLEIGRAHV